MFLHLEILYDGDTYPMEEIILLKKILDFKMIPIGASGRYHLKIKAENRKDINVTLDKKQAKRIRKAMKKHSINK